MIFHQSEFVEYKLNNRIKKKQILKFLVKHLLDNENSVCRWTFGFIWLISCSSVLGNQQLNSHNHVIEVFKLVISISFKNHSLSKREPIS